MPLGPPWGPPMGSPHGAPPWGPPMGPLFPEKIIRGFAANIFFRLHDRGGPMGPPHGALFPEKNFRGFAANNFFRLHDRSPGIFRLPIARMKMILVPIESLYKKLQF